MVFLRSMMRVSKQNSKNPLYCTLHQGDEKKKKFSEVGQISHYSPTIPTYYILIHKTRYIMISGGMINGDPILTTIGSLLTMYLNSHPVTGTLASTIDHFNFVFSTLRSLQCKDCNFCLCSIDVFLNATLVNT